MERMVPPEINNPNPGAVLLVGRDPGFNEAQIGRPFVGQAGEVLDRTLALIGLRRKDVNLINRVPWRPADNKFYNHEPWAVKDGLVMLLDAIEELQPGLIVAMGNEANYDLVPNWPGESIYQAKGIQDRRGYFWENPRLPCPVMSTIHPALVLYKTMPNKLFLEIDMSRIREYINGNLPITHFPESEIARHPQDLFQLQGQNIVSFDIETTWGGTKLLCIAFYGEKMKRPVVVLEKDFEWCLPYLSDPGIPFLAHNGAFDTYFLEHKMGIRVLGYRHDTSVLHWAMYPELAGKPETGGEVQGGITRKSLSFLASQHLNVPWWKEYTDDLQRMAELCGRDVFATRHLFEVMFPEATEMQCLRQYRVSMDMIPILNRAQARGILIDNDLRKSRMKALAGRQSSLESSARESGLSWIESAGLESYRWTKQCPCCGGGKTKKQLCWKCAGFEKAPSKKDLVERCSISTSDQDYSKMLKADLETLLLKPCKNCGGSGELTGFDFNPMSPKQMVDLLYGELRVPKYTIVPTVQQRLKKDSGPNASEDTMKRILEWASE